MTGALDGKVAIVTGAGRGLGRAMAPGLAKEGASVVATAARERDEIDHVAGAGGGKIMALLADVTKLEDCDRTVAEAMRRFGRVDILVNNAARGMKYVSESFMTEPTHFWETDAAAYRLVIETNVIGLFQMAQAAARPMREQRWGRIINISMGHETMRRKGFSPYGPSKAALESATIIWAQDLDGSGVTVNALLPGGATLTGMIPESFPAAMKAKLLPPEAIVPPLIWLASDASGGVTGARFNAARWRTDRPIDEAITAAREMAGWPGAS